ncbi:PREDICTED: LOW QUALITY PROTEIN: dynein heavy chain domain-containing protein 1 [Gekko japonicus]|uniref:LOW QUALITY PROTEIN: dynein heavy chain domain-containing protein 1 n=1 Tax=Gekko japonicus TaxID=146911 RepID=A0ABM1L3F8_GEKJA|nr:PREDICTED: LOW QUALITY PROTEIN: dynein heavy chain domain-containing protein 1 [Gekko japonicus]
MPPVEGTWAWSVRQRLATQLQETGRPEPRQVEALVAELVAVFAAVLQQSSRRAWLRLMEALRLLAPFRQLLAARRAELLPYLEGLCYQYRSSQALVSDLDVLGALGRAFPEDRSQLWAPPPRAAACPREPDSPAKVLPSGSGPVFAGLPCPFTPDWVLEDASGLVRPDPVSLQELQRCLGAVGSAISEGEAPWASCLGLMSLSLATDLPVEYPSSPSHTLHGRPSSELCPTAPRAVPVPVREKAAPAASQRPAMTGLQVVEVFVRNRQAWHMHFLYLNVAPSRHFRPYDLVVVPKRLANPEHYVFSSFGVLHVHPEEGSEALTLGAWHREAVLWQLMQHIPFFRLFLVRKAFVRWYCNTNHLQRLKHQEMLRCQLLQAVPHFGAALLQISRLLQELRTVHWLPHTTTRCCNFPELQQGLAQENSSAQDLLSRFLTFCSSILELVREDTYKMVHGLQTQVQGQKLYVTKESLYQQRVESEGLRRRLQEAESWLQKLGFLALLVNFLICQSLVSIVQEEVTTFVSHTMQELEACLLGSLDAVVESVLLVTRINSEAPRTPKQPHEAVPEDGRDPACLCAVPGKEAASSAGQAFSELLQRLPLERLSGEEPQLVYHLDLKMIGGLEVVGHRLRGQYPLLSREQLEKDLRSDCVVQKARAKQQALLAAALSETQHLCREYSWLAEIYRFAHSWGASRLEDMKGWPCEEYVNRITKLRVWMSRVKQVPRSVVTTNRLLFVDCTGIHQDILPLLASINEDILSLLLKETTQRSELLIAEMSAVLQLYMNISSDIFTIAKCSQKLEHYQGQLAELQESVEYVRALNEVIQQCFRPLSSSEETLENSLLDTWDAFVYQQREVSDFIVSRRLSIIAELSSSLQKATRELQEILATVTVGRFRDPFQNPRAMEEELHKLLQHFQATVVRVAELCRSQRILTGECMDVSFVTGNQGIIEVHVRIWQLLRIVSEQVTEWKCLAFFKFNAALAIEKTEEWLSEAFRIEESLPAAHPVLQSCIRAIKNLQKYLPLLRKLGSHFVKVGCWKEIFAAMGAKCPLNMQFTLGQLLALPLLEHSETILRIYACEKGRYRSRDTLNRLQRFWSEKQFRLVNFILNVPYQPPGERFRRPASSRQRPAKREYISKDSGTYVLSDTAELKATVEQSLLTLQNMILSPYSSELREEAVSWTSTLRTFESLLEAWVTLQQKWVFLNMVLYEMDISLPSAELESRFQRVDAHLRELMQVTCQDPLVLSSVRPGLGSCRESCFAGGPLQAALAEASGELQGIIGALAYVLEATRMGFPRLFFLSNEELVAMVATATEPADASAWSQRCFPGVRQLQLTVPSAAQTLSAFSAQAPELQVAGLVGDHGERLRLCGAVPLTPKATQWLCALEQRMKETLFHRLQDCLAQRLALRPQLDVAFEKPPGPTDLPLHLLAEHWASLGAAFPVQCVLLAEEALWRADLEEALVEPGGGGPLGLERKLGLKLEALTHYLRNYRSVHAWQPDCDALGVLLGGLLVVTIRQRDVLSRLREQKVSSPRAFAWARHFKYRVALKAEKAKAARVSPGRWVGSPPGCWAEVLDSCFPYDYEYLGPSAHLLGSPGLDRTFLGLLLALEDFRCGGLLGLQGVGKSHTAQGLAQALGRQLVTLHCSALLPIRCLSRYLCGAVHAGAWLLLESAERLEPAVLSAFSQRLADLRRLCLNIREGRGGATSPTSQRSADSDSDGEGQPAVALPELGTDEAEPYHPRVVGHILFGGRLLRVRETYGCVATLGRLPEPLRLVLRPLVILPPDLAKLAEVSLLAAGFREARRLAEKLSAFLCLEGELGPGPPASRTALLREVVGRAIDILFSPGPRGDPLLSKARPSPRTTFFLGLEEEPAVVKALCLSPLLRGPECPRLRHVWDLLRGIFPSAALQLPEPLAPPRLQSALVAQLHENKLHADSQLLDTASQLFQALGGAGSVLLLGPPGSGKTTTWQVLAKALSRLAANEAAALVLKAGAHGTAGTPSSIVPVSAVCVWPNSLSVPEFLGSLEEGTWQDGVLTRLLQRAAASALAGGAGGVQQWVVLDGTASAAWLEPVSSLLGPRPSLSLPSGQKLQPPGNLKVLFEMSDASGMPPSVCAHCAVLHCSGSGLWQGVLASALGPVGRTYSLTQQSLAMLQELAEDVFPPTLAFLQQQHCSSVLAPHASPRSPGGQGVQETTAFARILHALLEQYLRREKIRSAPAQELKVSRSIALGTSPSSVASRLDESVPRHHHMVAQSFFAFAYLWGFGGHLHPRHWPLFEQFARRALLSSRYSIQLPSAASAFDLCPLPEDGSLQPFDGRYLSCRVKNIPATFCVLPQYERVLYVLDLLLGTSQPVLLIGEPGCGKTSFAETLVQPNHLWQRLRVSFGLRAAHLRELLQRKAPRDKGPSPFGKPAWAAARKGRCLFLVEDLHMAPLDPGRGTSPVVESLRQALSHHQFYHAETLELQHCPAAGFNCFGTLSALVLGAPPLCPRFGRLFSVVVLPPLAREALLGMHTPAALAWLERFPLLTRHNDLAAALVKATLDAYEAVRSQFPPSPACCLLPFSLHSLRRVFKGLFLLRPRPGIHLSCPLEEQGVKAVYSRRSSAGSRVAVGPSYTVVLTVRLIVRLWLHEALRTFGDPLRGERRQAACGQLLLEIATANFCARRPFLRIIPSLGTQSSHHPSRSHISFYPSSAWGSISKGKRRMSSKKETSGPLLPAHMLMPPGDLPGDIVFSKELGPERHGPGARNPYQERLWRALETQLAPLLPPGSLLPPALLRHVVHLCRLLCVPEQHGALVAFRRSTGRRALVALAARATGSLLMELPPEADEGPTLALLRLASWEAGVQGRRVLLLVPPGLSPGPLHLGLGLMGGGTCPGLYGPEDTAPIVQALLQENLPSSLQTHHNLVPCVAKAAALIHTSATTYATYLAPRLPLVTPRNFLDLLDIFAWLLDHLREQNCKRMDQMKLALHKMGEVSEKQQAHSRDVHALQEKLDKIKQELVESQQEVERQQRVLKQQEKECQLYEARIDALTKERDELEKAKDRQMNKDYREALAGLRAQDIEELRSYRQPPEQVVWVTDTLCKMFEQEPGWENAKQMLGQEDFYQELVFYPKDTISVGLFEALGKVVSKNDFRVASVKSASQAAAALWQWICAIYFYHRALRSWQPSMERLERCDAQINSEKMNLGHSRLRSEQLRDATRARIKELKETQQNQQKLLHQLTQSLQAREEASTVENSVAEHMANWTVATQVLENQHSTVAGDALLCAAALVYLGPFPPARREELLRKWQAVCGGAQVSPGPDDVSQLLQKELSCPGSASCGPPLLPVQQPFSPATLLSTARQQRAWDRTHKPKDPESRLTAMLLHSEAHRQAHRWPLLVDPDKQATVWLLVAATLEDEESQALINAELVPEMVELGDYEAMPEDNLEVLSLTDPDLEQNLLTAASVGTPVLLTDFEKNIPWCPALQQLMQKETLLPPGAKTPPPEQMSVSPSFQLYLCTRLPLEALATDSCADCSNFTKQAGKNRAGRLKSHLLEASLRPVMSRSSSSRASLPPPTSRGDSAKSAASSASGPPKHKPDKRSKGLLALPPDAPKLKKSHKSKDQSVPMPVVVLKSTPVSMQPLDTQAATPAATLPSSTPPPQQSPSHTGGARSVLIAIHTQLSAIGFPRVRSCSPGQTLTTR